jgi:hypothetical protein
MKKVHLAFSAIALSFVITACQRDVSRNEPLAAVITPTKLPNGGDQARQSNTGVCDPGGYSLVLESRTQVGTNWEWVWSIRNTNPGNGNQGTYQDLSHWGMSFGSCFDWSTVVGAATSSNGDTWSYFLPIYGTDNSQGCYGVPVMKYDLGTTGTAKSYYKLIINTEYPVGTIPGYYKSGGNTGCCTFNFLGVGCETVPGEVLE